MEGGTPGRQIGVGIEPDPHRHGEDPLPKERVLGVCAGVRARRMRYGAVTGTGARTTAETATTIDTSNLRMTLPS